MIIPDHLRSLLTEPSLDSRLLVHGGAPLYGTITIQGAKNIALQAIAAALLTEDDVTLENIPKIQDIQTNLAILQKLGAKIIWNTETSVTINCSNVKSNEIDPNESEKTTGSKYFIPLLVQRFGAVTTGGPGGDRIGGDDRYQITDRIRETYARMGILCSLISQADQRSTYEFRNSSDALRTFSLEEPYFGTTVQTLLFRSLGQNKEPFILYNPAIEPEIFETVNLLKAMGAQIHYNVEPRSFTITPVPRLHGTHFRIISDPNALVSYASMIIATNGEAVLTGIDHTEKVDAFLNILRRMRVNFEYEKEGQNLILKPSRKTLLATNLETNFWPCDCHTDWQQILTPLLALASGVSMIDENFYPERFKVESLRVILGDRFTLISDPDRIKRLSFRRDGKPHTLRIQGEPNLIPKAGDVSAPYDIRGATGLLTALLAAPGWSLMRNFNQILRGLAETPELLRALHATVIDKKHLQTYEDQ